MIAILLTTSIVEEHNMKVPVARSNSQVGVDRFISLTTSCDASHVASGYGRTCGGFKLCAVIPSAGAVNNDELVGDRVMLRCTANDHRRATEDLRHVCVTKLGLAQFPRVSPREGYFPETRHGFLSLIRLRLSNR